MTDISYSCTDNCIRTSALDDSFQIEKAEKNYQDGSLDNFDNIQGRRHVYSGGGEQGADFAPPWSQEYTKYLLFYYRIVSLAPPWLQKLPPPGKSLADAPDNI